MMNTIEIEVPEGYEIVTTTPHAELGEISGNIIIPLIKVRSEDFNWYRDKYLKHFFDTDNWKSVAPWTDFFVDEIFDKIPFEYNIGLLRFICIMNGISEDSFWGFCALLHNKIWSEIKEDHIAYSVVKICPNEFIASIFTNHKSIH